jgi:hypothetical protein
MSSLTIAAHAKTAIVGMTSQNPFLSSRASENATMDAPSMRVMTAKPKSGEPIAQTFDETSDKLRLVRIASLIRKPQYTSSDLFYNLTPERIAEPHTKLRLNY